MRLLLRREAQLCWRIHFLLDLPRRPIQPCIIFKLPQLLLWIILRCGFQRLHKLRRKPVPGEFGEFCLPELRIGQLLQSPKCHLRPMCRRKIW